MKTQIVPREWKSDIDRILTEESLGANRYFATICPSLRGLIEYQALLDPCQFYDELVSRWDWHHSFFEGLLEPALPLLISDNVFDLPPEQVRGMAKAYEATSLVDQATLVPTAATKKHIDYWLRTLSSKMMLSEEVAAQLITPPTPAFWISYLLDHLEYLSEKDRIIRGRMRKRLLAKYHAEDEEIFVGRVAKLSIFRKMDKETLERRKCTLLRSQNLWREHFYLCLENPYCDALGRTIVYDNTEEYRVLTTLIGISGFVLRKKTLNLLRAAKIIKGDVGGGIYQFADEVVLTGLGQLEAYRKEAMYRNVLPLRQSRIDTCACASLTMVMSYFGACDLNVQAEETFYERARASGLPGTHMSGLLKIADTAGFKTILAHSEEGMFRQNPDFISRELFMELLRQYQGHLAGLSQRAEVLTSVEINSRYLVDLLQQGYVVILAGGRQILHAITLTGYNSSGLTFIDPLDGRSHAWSERQVEFFLKTPIGSWCLAVKRDTAATDALFGALPGFIAEARSYLR